MNSYQISDLERLTGIKAHTIRIWERRYKLIEPHRTTTNIRFYDDEQVKKLLKVVTLINQGLKISKISTFSEREINSRIKELEKIAPEDAICAGFINDLTSSMLDFEEAAFEKVLSSAVLRFGVYEAMLKVFYPFLRQTGLMWSSNQTLPAQEHFASAIIRRKLIVAIDGLPAPSKRSKSFLLFLPVEEWHEIGLLLSDYIIRAKGYKTIYLSQNVPLGNIQNVIKSTKPTHLLTFYVSRQDHGKLKQDLYDLSNNNKKCQIFIGGNTTLFQGVERPKNTTLLLSPSELLNHLKS